MGSEMCIRDRESGKLRGAGWDYENMQEGGAELAIPLSQGVSLAQACAELPFTFFTAHSKQVVDYIYPSPWNLSPDYMYMCISMYMYPYVYLYIY